MIFLSGCDEYCVPVEKHDEVVGKTKDDFRSLSTPPCEAVAQRPKWCMPTSPKACLPPCFSRKVSLSLSGKIPLNEAFFELAQQANINIILDTPLTKARTIYYRATSQPLVDVLENLCHMGGGLRYYFEHNALHVCSDTPYQRTHNVQFLLGCRTTQTQTTVKTDILAEGVNTRGRNQTDNGASINVSAAHTANFWEELERNLSSILCAQQGASKEGRTAYSLNRYSGMLSLFGTEKEHRMVARYLAQLQKLVSTQVLIEAKIIEIDLFDEYKGGINWNAFTIRSPFHLGAQQAAAAAAGALGVAGANILGGAPQNTFSPGGCPPYVGPNGLPLPGAGALVNGFNPLIRNPVHKSGLSGGSRGGNDYSFRLETEHLSALATFMEKFGTVRTLANPRLTVLNNQSAVLKVAHNEVFFELQLRDELSMYGGVNIQKAQSRIQTVPIGLILYVHPSVNFDTGEIVVALHPTISRVIDTKTDPAIALSYSSISPEMRSEIPVVQVREMDSIIAARENQIIITGGLMEESTDNKTTGIPGLSEIPVLGNLFKFKNNRRRLTELVILLKLSIVGDHSNVSPADARLYECFTKDPRPLPMPCK